MDGAQAVAGADFARLILKKEMCETAYNVIRNISRTLCAPYVRFNELIGTRTGAVSICGSGPSLRDEYTELVGDVMACNGAHDFLIERGIIPTYGMLFDAAPAMADFITPHHDVIYLIASRCHEAVFRKLEDYNVVVWHCMGDPGLVPLLEAESINEPAIHGGSAAVLRAAILAWVMGHQECHLFGCDSSYEDGQHHAGKTLVPETEIDVCPVIGGQGGKWFKSTAWMAGQVEDFIDMFPAMTKKGYRMVVHGRGLLPEMARAMGAEVITKGEVNAGK